MINREMKTEDTSQAPDTRSRKMIAAENLAESTQGFLRALWKFSGGKISEKQLMNESVKLENSLAEFQGVDFWH